ncbi:hypothetical protein [uncultured Thiodictyon sp.]|uniref:hypothetical protein n=1 Tax=uncultured Thiodictyon sp. TaxID=1846217 RepID=UPI0025D08EC6|nr:hypothetical protein [uncultured Thiodictyon sp.]
MDTGLATGVKVGLTEPLRLRWSDLPVPRAPTAPKKVSNEFEQVGQDDLLQGAGAAGCAPVLAAGRAAEDALP